ncbi:heat shock protein DDB_G0288861 [Halyomorpha halys]|uniref:heat shock protein DDB_G0288861 n=1 Tax=Halyomorpha halys TaxID=286706 RepID=UPI0006D4CB26|nr:activating signal cointegrator 1 complex subunit 2 homolog [Halyomorpha halys]
MNSCIFVVLVLLLETDCRPVGQDVLAGEEFLAVFMRSHRPRSTYRKTTTTQVTTEPTTPSTATTTEVVPTTLETEPPSVVSVRVSSSVRKEAVHEPVNEPIHEAVSAAAQRSHFSVESSGYREASERREEDSVAEASQDVPLESLNVEENKPIAEALTLEESGIHYESRVSSETSHSRIYFSQPKHSSQSVLAQTPATRKYHPLPPLPEEDEAKYEPQILTQAFSQDNGNRKYGPEILLTQTHQESKTSPHIIFTQDEQEHKSSSDDTSKFEPEVIVTRQETKYGPEIVVTQTHSESKYTPELFATQAQTGSQPVNNNSEEERRAETVISQTQETRKYIGQNREQRQYTPQNSQQQERSNDGSFVAQAPPSEPAEQYKSQPNEQQEERNYEQPEQNYEVDEAISVMTNGRAHGVQTESPSSHKFGFVQEGRNYRKYRVEEKTPDGFIVGEYGVVNHDGGGIRGVRYTADGSISPRLIYEALVKFLSLK